ncbi:MAG: hypothetical protein R3Y24_01020 [Eubacteriales bacterium]
MEGSIKNLSQYRFTCAQENLESAKVLIYDTNIDENKQEKMCRKEPHMGGSIFSCKIN